MPFYCLICINVGRKLAWFFCHFWTAVADVFLTGVPAADTRRVVEQGQRNKAQPAQRIWRPDVVSLRLTFRCSDLCCAGEAATVFMTPEGEYYDPEKDARLSSPGLAPTQVNYKPEESPPPYIPISSSSSSPSSSPSSPGPTESKGSRPFLETSALLSAKKNPKRKRRRKGHTRPSLGDTVLLNHLDPNRPDIAREAAQRALNSASQSEAEDDSDRDMSGDGGGEYNGKTQQDGQNSAQATELTTTAWAALNDAAAGDLVPQNDVLSASVAMHDVVQMQSSSDVSVVRCPSLSGDQLVGTPLRSSNPPLPWKIRPPSRGVGEGEDESIATSPALAKFAIPAAEANPDSTLPAMQKSPPRSASTHSPDGTQSLPSLQTALSQLADTPTAETPNGVSPFSQNPGQSPNIARPHQVAGNPAGTAPSTNSDPSPASSKDTTSMFPPGYPIHPTFWRKTPKDGSFGTASPSSVPSLTSVASSYPTPNDIVSPESSSSPQMSNDALAAAEAATSATFKCTHPGCTAQPFLTQYLLNSHANVHSSNRPHYCPVASCPRGVGGEGFKRKNEMIRHGLVHKSPGYMCPFCVDQQHRYPRPDNLQRHVRGHHPDKARNDPQLRSVLAPGSAEGGRGRRRRLGA